MPPKVARQQPPATEPLVQNLVLTANILKRINLRVLAEATKGHYDPNKFPACTLRFRDPPVAPSVYGNGNVVIVGAKSRDQALHGLYYVLDILHRVFPSLAGAEAHNLCLENMVASFDVGFKVNLKLLFDDYVHCAQYAKEDIRALRLWPDGMNTSLVLTIWTTGKAHVAGAKTPEEVTRVYKHVDFHKYRLRDEYRQLEPGWSVSARSREFFGPSKATPEDWEKAEESKELLLQPSDATVQMGHVLSTKNSQTTAVAENGDPEEEVMASGSIVV